MFGLRYPASLSRRTMTGQGTDGTPTFSTAVVWTGKGLAVAFRGDARYRPAGVETVALYRVFLPGAAVAPLAGDQLTVNGVVYLVEYPKLDSRGHHYEVQCRLVAH